MGGGGGGGSSFPFHRHFPSTLACSIIHVHIGNVLLLYFQRPNLCNSFFRGGGGGYRGEIVPMPLPSTNHEITMLHPGLHTFTFFFYLYDGCVGKKQL